MSYRPEDQSRIRIAISLRRVDPGDIPPSAKAPLARTNSIPASQASQGASTSTPITGTATGAVSTPGASQKKRKAAFEASFGSQPNVPQPSQSQTQAHAQVRPVVGTQVIGRGSHPSQAIVVEDEVEEDVPDDQPIDELYCTFRTNIVGIQYYKGSCHVLLFLRRRRIFDWRN